MRITRCDWCGALEATAVTEADRKWIYATSGWNSEHTQIDFCSSECAANFFAAEDHFVTWSALFTKLAEFELVPGPEVSPDATSDTRGGSAHDAHPAPPTEEAS